MIDTDHVPDDRDTLGWEALAWMSRCLLDPEGKPYRVQPAEVRLALRLYETSTDGGWALSPEERCEALRGASVAFQTAIHLFEGLGPCRFNGRRDDGTPYGRPRDEVRLNWEYFGC